MDVRTDQGTLNNDCEFVKDLVSIIPIRNSQVSEIELEE